MTRAYKIELVKQAGLVALAVLVAIACTVTRVDWTEVFRRRA